MVPLWGNLSRRVQRCPETNNHRFTFWRQSELSHESKLAHLQGCAKFLLAKLRVATSTCQSGFTTDLARDAMRFVNESTVCLCTATQNLNSSKRATVFFLRSAILAIFFRTGDVRTRPSEADTGAPINENKLLLSFASSDCGLIAISA